MAIDDQEYVLPSGKVLYESGGIPDSDGMWFYPSGDCPFWVEEQWLASLLGVDVSELEEVPSHLVEQAKALMRKPRRLRISPSFMGRAPAIGWSKLLFVGLVAGATVSLAMAFRRSL